MEKKIRQDRLMESSAENRALFMQCEKCDKNDYVIAAACGAIGGMVDIFMVGAPQNSTIRTWSDQTTDRLVKSFAKKMGWNPKEQKADSVASAIGFLEKKYKVNYDQRHTKDVGDLFRMSAKNHHMKSLSHSPDVIGLFFSILNQFTSTSSFIDHGQIITIQTETFELRGHNFISKLYCGIANWFGHLMSDIAGSSGSVGKGGRGTGIVIPFYELFLKCDFGRFQVGQDRQDLATIATRAFQEGYDFRFGMAAAVPVLLTDLSIRLIWAVRRFFQYKKPFRECIPTQTHPDLRVMLLIGSGTLCLLDLTDAGIRSGGNYLVFFMRLNLPAWFRFTCLVIKEVCIRVGFQDGIQNQIDAYKKVNEALQEYLLWLKRIDIEGYKREVQNYNALWNDLKSADSEARFHKILATKMETLSLGLPWEGELDDFMKDKSKRLVFK